MYASCFEKIDYFIEMNEFKLEERKVSSIPELKSFLHKAKIDAKERPKYAAQMFQYLVALAVF